MTISRNSLQLSEFIRALSDGDLRDAIVKGLEGDAFGPIFADFEVSPEVRLSAIYGVVDVATQQRLKREVAELARIWEPRDRPALFCRLASLAGLIGAADTLPYLRRQIEAFRVDPARGTAAVLKILVELIAVLQGFALDPRALDLLESLFSSDDVSPPCGSQLFLGLCRAVPRDYPRFVKRWLWLQAEHPDFYPRPDLILERFIRVVSPGVLEREFHKLDVSDRRQLVALMVGGQRPMLELGPSKAAHIITLRRRAELHGETQPISLDLEIPDLVDDMAELAVRTHGARAYLRRELGRIQRDIARAEVP